MEQFANRSVKKSIPIKDGNKILLLAIPDSLMLSEDSQNIVRVNPNGELVWRVDPAPWVPNYGTYFYDLWIEKKTGEIKASVGPDFECEINPETGHWIAETVAGGIVIKTVGIGNGHRILLLESLEETPWEEMSRNIVRVNSENQIIWRIDQAPSLQSTGSSFYTNIWLEETGELIAGAWSGVDCAIDPSSGHIISEKFTK